MSRQEKWDQRFLGLACEIAKWSKDPSTKVGAVIVRPNLTIAATGFNGFPPGANDDPALYADREYKYKHVVHAERNAINFLTETPNRFALYTSFPACPDCVQLIGDFGGITRIVQPDLLRLIEGRTPGWVAEWMERIAESEKIGEAYGIEMVYI